MKILKIREIKKIKGGRRPIEDDGGLIMMIDGWLHLGMPRNKCYN